MPTMGQILAEALPIGMIALDHDRREVVIPIFQAGVALPARWVREFRFPYDGMSAVRVELTVGEGTRRSEVGVFARLELVGLPPRTREDVLRLEVEHGVDRVRCQLTELAIGASVGGDHLLPLGHL